MQYDVSDGALLGRVVDRNDQSAFESLMERHGAMALSVCRRILGDFHDAEDAFQADFYQLPADSRGT